MSDVKFCQRKDIPQPTVIFHTNSQEMPEGEDDKFGQLRLIAKKGQKPDGSTATMDEQIIAAKAVIDTLFTSVEQNELVSTVKASLKAENLPTNKRNTILVAFPLRPEQGAKTTNALTLVFGEVVRDLLNEAVTKDYPNVSFDVKPLSYLTRTSRTTADPIGRIVRQHLFDSSGLNDSNLAIMVDDHVEVGGAFINMANTLEQEGVKVLAATTLTGLPESHSLKVDKEVKQTLLAMLKDEQQKTILNRALSNVGLSLDTLSNREALTIIAYLANANNEEDKTLLTKAMRSAGCDEDRIVGKDPLWKSFQEPAKSIGEFEQEIIHRFQSGKERSLYAD